MFMRFKRLFDFAICIVHHIGCCFCIHPKKHCLHHFHRQYKILDQIGRGGFGRVYQVICGLTFSSIPSLWGYRIDDGLPVAVKFIKHHQVADWTIMGIQAIPTEICMLADCQDCEGIVRLVDWFYSRTGFLVVMERPRRFMDLFDLVNILGRLEEQVARRIFGQIVNTVIGLFKRHSLVHRDIKDENILLDLDSNKAFLCDFGAAQPFDRAKSKQFQGTRSYCPPEVFKQKTVYLPLEGTVWSLGILLYTMMIGYPPFRDEAEICLAQLRFPVKISEECHSLIQGCLCPNPENRLSLEQIQAHRWLTNVCTLDEAAGRLDAKRISRLWRQRERGSLGTGRTETSESSEEECSYRANILNEPKPISIPLQRLISSTGNQQWNFASDCSTEVAFHPRPDSGFGTASEAILRKSLYDNLTDYHGNDEIASNSNHSVGSDWFSSAYSSSYYSLGNSLDLPQTGLSSFEASSAESIVSSTYFSVKSVGQFAAIDDDEDVTIRVENCRKVQKNGSYSSDDEVTMKIPNNKMAIVK